MYKSFLMLLCFCWGTSTGFAQTPLPPLTTVPAVDVPRYMGTWHEVARYPNVFQRRCVSDTSARYTLQANGRVEVLNRCRNADGMK